jgi:DNA-binding winged helix-turn-helix (wHTH) protein
VPFVSQSHTISFGDFCADLSNHVLYKNDQRVRLTPKEFDTLRVLAENSGQVVAKEEIIQEVWRDTFIGDTSLTRNISVLRKILGPNIIETVPKRGYLFVAQTEESVDGWPCGEKEHLQPADAINEFNSISEPKGHSPAVQRSSLKGIAISALVLLVEAALKRNH